MRLIKTCDGLIGLALTGKMIWCDTVDEAVTITTAHFQRMEVPRERIETDILYALDTMAKTGHTVAEFGVFGTFMFTKPEPEYEF